MNQWSIQNGTISMQKKKKCLNLLSYYNEYIYNLSIWAVIISIINIGLLDKKKIEIKKKKHMYMFIIWI